MVVALTSAVAFGYHLGRIGPRTHTAIGFMVLGGRYCECFA